MLAGGIVIRGEGIVIPGGGIVIWSEGIVIWSEGIVREGRDQRHRPFGEAATAEGLWAELTRRRLWRCWKIAVTRGTPRSCAANSLGRSAR